MSRPFTVAALIAGYNEEDVIAQVVRGLVDEGVQVYFLDHHSTDRTRAEVEAFLGRGVIGIETCPADRAQGEAAGTFAPGSILARKEELARTLDADWFIHGDADEFRESPWRGETLLEGIRRVDAFGYNAIDFHVLNFSPTTADAAAAADIRARMQYYQPGQIIDSSQITCWKKTDQPVVLASTGGHSAQFAGRRIFPVRFLLRHYPIRSQAHGERNPEAEGASFVREPSDLLRYDADAVRLNLWLRHRDVERVERLAAVSQDEADRLADANVALTHDLQQLRAEVDALRAQPAVVPLRDAVLHGRATPAEPFKVGVSLPVVGAIRITGDARGYSGDGWAGPALRFRGKVVGPVTSLRISGVIPADLGGDQDLRLAIGDRDWTHRAGAGQFEWVVPIALKPGDVFECLIAASRSWRPGDSGASMDQRDLAWHVAAIEAR